MAPVQSPGIFAALFCEKCGKRQRSLNHTCQPSAVEKHQHLNAWSKKSQQAGQPPKGKK